MPRPSLPPYRERSNARHLPRRADAGEYQGPGALTVTVKVITTPGTAAFELATPPSTYRLRIRHVKCIQETPDGRRVCDLWFQDPADASKGPIENGSEGDLDTIIIPNGRFGVSRQWSTDSGPTTWPRMRLYGQFTTAPTAGVNHIFVIQQSYER